MVFAAACGALALSTSARAEFFVGGAGGISDWPDAACSQAASSCDHRSGTWLVRGGYMFLPYLGLEARYMDLGRATSSVQGTTINSTPTWTDLRSSRATCPWASRPRATGSSSAARTTSIRSP